MSEDLNVALPGLQEMESPFSDALPPVDILEPYTKGNPWSVEVINPRLIETDLPTRPAVTGELRFYHFSDATRPPSLVIPVNVLDAAAWTFSVEELVELDLAPNLWLWIVVENSEEEEVQIASGLLVVRHAVD